MKKAKATAAAARPDTPLDTTTRDSVGRTPLHQAAFHGYADTVRRLLAQQAEVDARDDAGRTAAHWAAFKGHVNILQTLLAGGADVNAQDNAGRTPLKMALAGEKETAEVFLRERGAQ
jgi:ankyrin repeat protein